MNRELPFQVDDSDQASKVSEHVESADLEGASAAKQLAVELGRLLGQHLAKSAHVEQTDTEDGGSSLSRGIREKHKL